MRKCQLAVSRKENIVAGGTIVRECGPNYLVVVDAPYEPNTSLPIPIPNDITTIGEAVGYEVLWPAHLVILSLILTRCNIFIYLHIINMHKFCFNST